MTVGTELNLWLRGQSLGVPTHVACLFISGSRQLPVRPTRDSDWTTSPCVPRAEPLGHVAVESFRGLGGTLKNQLALRLADVAQPSVAELIALADGASVPADSLLSMTLLDLLGLEMMGEADTAWEAVSSLTVADLDLGAECASALVWPYLSREDSLEVVVSSTMDYLMALIPGDHHFDEIVRSVVRELSVRLGFAVGLQSQLLSAESFFSRVQGTLLSLPLPAVRDADILRQTFPDRRVRSLADLLDLSERAIVLELGFSGAAVKAVKACWLLREEFLWLSAVRDGQLSAVQPSGLLDEVRSALCASLPRTQRGETNVRVLLRRLGLENGIPMTLEETGTPFGITRERVRQIEAKTVKALDLASFMDELISLRIDVYCIVASHGWGMPMEQLARALAEERGWFEAPTTSALKSISDCLPECTPDSGEGFVLLSRVDCSGCAAIEQIVDEVATAGVPILLPEFWDRVVSAAASVRPDCHACARHDRVVFEALLCGVLAGRDELRKSDGWILPRALGGRRPTSLAFKAEQVLRRSGRSLHFKEVAALLAAAEPAKIPPTPRMVYAALERQPDLISWGPGSFIHKENMPFPYALLRSIEESIRERLQRSSAPPMLSVHGVYEMFREELEDAVVPSELALYSLLRISGEPGLLYPKYPQIYLEAGFEERLPLTLVLDDYVRNAGGVVTLEELRGFVMQDMGFKEFQLAQALALLPSILRVGDGAYLHVEYARVPARVLDKIIRYAEDLVHEEAFVSVQRIYTDLEVDCALNGIKSPEMLFSLVQLDEREDLVANRYPLLVHREDSSASRITVQASLAAYLKERNAPCSSADLEEEFVGKRGYEERTVHLAWLHPDVYRYLPGSLVHKTTIDWGDTKQAELEQSALRLAEDYVNAGRYFATIRDLLEHGDLPDIGRELVWTQQLAADLLSRSETCSLLGNARNAYVANPNRYGISNLGDLVAEIVRSEFGGGVSLSLIEERLHTEGVILRSLTPAMLGADSGAMVVGQEVVLRRLMNA